MISFKATISTLVLIAIVKSTVHSRPTRDIADLNITSAPISCIDEEGKATDWFVAYKFPLLNDQDSPLNTGYAYSYISANGKPKRLRQKKSFSRELSEKTHPTRTLTGLVASMVNYLTGNSVSKETESGSLFNNEWTISQKLINQPDSAIFRTLAPAYNINSSNVEFLSLIIYNDQPPDGSDQEKYAHAKGVVIMDDITGDAVWLSHSTPKFPPRHKDHLEFESNAAVNGQTFLCFTFNLRDSGEKVADHLLTMNPYVYDSIITERLLDVVPEFKHFIWHWSSENTPRPESQIVPSAKNDEPVDLHSSIDTVGGMKIDLFSKSQNFNKDLYANWLNTELETNLLVQSWQNGGGGPLNSSCTVHGRNVINVEAMQILQGGKTFATWSHHHDHSKWAMSDNKERSQVCVADNNRMESQKRRGGGALCIANVDVWSLFKTTIGKVESC